MQKLKTIVVMPGYNAEATLRKTISDIPFDFIDEIIFVDDASTDKTIEVLESFCLENPKLTITEEEFKKNPTKIFVTIHIHKNNLGYGGNQKSCYDLALKERPIS